MMSVAPSNSIPVVTNGQNNSEESETPIETIVIDPDATLVELIACRLRVIDGLDGLTQVETLNLRQNLLETIENISHLITLKHLDLYDNHITRIEGLLELIKLKHLDLSFSKISI